MIEARASGDPVEALGDPHRRDILRLLSDGDKPVREIAAALPISRPAVSRHLRLLKEAGLVAEQAQGTRRIYHLRDQGMRGPGLSGARLGRRRPAVPVAGREHRGRFAGMTEPLRISLDGRPGLVVLQGGVGGRIYERSPDGVEHAWGHVTVWQPPARLAYLWYLGTDPAQATEVEIRFLAQGAVATRIEIEHHGWERLGTSAGQWRDRNRAGWQSLLPHFAAAIEKGDN